MFLHQVGNTSHWSSSPDADPKGQVPPPSGPPPKAERIDKTRTRAIHNKLANFRDIFRNVDRHPNAEAHDKWESHVVQTLEWFSARPDLTTPLSHIVYKPDEQMFIDTADDILSGTYPNEFVTGNHILHRIQQIRHPLPIMYPYDSQLCYVTSDTHPTQPAQFPHPTPDDQPPAPNSTNQTLATTSTHDYSTSSPGANSSQARPANPEAPTPPTPPYTPTPYTPAHEQKSNARWVCPARPAHISQWRATFCSSTSLPGP